MLQNGTELYYLLKLHEKIQAKLVVHVVFAQINWKKKIKTDMADMFIVQSEIMTYKTQ